MATPDQAVFGRYMLFNLTSVIDWQVVTTENQQQVDIDKAQQNSMRVTHDYKRCNQVYAEMTGIHRKLYRKKQGPYKITEVFTNSTVRVQQGQANKQKHNTVKASLR